MKATVRTSVIVRIGLVVVGFNAVNAATSPSPDPCSLLTQKQVSAVLAMNVEVGKHVASTVCAWGVPGQPFGIGGKKATLHFITQQAWEYANVPVPGKTITKSQVSGVGDQAVFGTTSGRLATLTVKKGNVFFVVQIYGFPIEQLQEKEKALALQVLTKL